jgi:hypothetical protein
MQKLALASIISTISATIATPALAASMTCSVGGGTNNGLVYTTTATSNGIGEAATTTNVVYYVDNSLGTASNKTSPAPPAPNPYTLVVSGDWCIDITKGSFSGNIAYGDYKQQTNITGFPTMDGRQTFVGANQAFNGFGMMGTATSGLPTISYSYFSTAGVTTQTQISSSCANGQTSILGKVCTSYATASKNWEGLSFIFTFDSTYYTFSGSLVGIDAAGSGLSQRTTAFLWTIDGIDPPAEVPVPAAAWLFGSSLVGLAGAARRRRSKVR